MNEPSTPEPTGVAPASGAGARSRELAHLSLNFVLDVAGQGIDGLKTLDSLLLMAINQANIAPLTRNPAARSRYGALDAAAPDDERRPVSVRAVAASLRLPYETARRNIRRLEGLGVCVVSEAGVVAPESFMRSEAYLRALSRCHETLFRLYLALRARGLLEALPPAHYVEKEPPVRAAARLMADYLLRTAEAVVGRTGELVSGLLLLPLAAAAAAPERGAGAAMSIAELSRRVQVPAETTRRHVAALVEQGLCRTAGAGVVLADADFATADFAGLLRDNAIAVNRMFAGLAERGVVDAWDKASGLAPERANGVG